MRQRRPLGVASAIEIATIKHNGEAGVKLRGAFDPKIQFGIGILVIAAVGCLVFTTVNSFVEPESVRLDFELMPVGFLLGAAIGVPVGIWRLRALRKAIPQVEGQFFLTQGHVIGRFREGANATTLQRAAFGWAFIVWFVLIAFTNGRVLLNGSLGCYILGQSLTGQTLPFIKLWRETRSVRH